ncbi:uncharacterized protein BJ171DRAFT_636202 [Polychytrium aggregatum]|uniref:uncharacterized protein n=1 Tax=Polychytrium aggregatum TaxID=110093 RepID=UPI0022FE7835|nr:uncharacterized protein BJ171DRAFT_636202 [Polychytrium aggregatum]KAI9207853.1 hypothetical protein BJ171DRAFT_636202 [Polychytrium aggregatum]
MKKLAVIAVLGTIASLATVCLGALAEDSERAPTEPAFVRLEPRDIVTMANSLMQTLMDAVHRVNSFTTAVSLWGTVGGIIRELLNQGQPLPIDQIVQASNGPLSINSFLGVLPYFIPVLSIIGMFALAMLTHTSDQMRLAYHTVYQIPNDVNNFVASALNGLSSSVGILTTAIGTAIDHMASVDLPSAISGFLQVVQIPQIIALMKLVNPTATAITANATLANSKVSVFQSNMNTLSSGVYYYSGGQAPNVSNIMNLIQSINQILGNMPDFVQQTSQLQNLPDLNATATQINGQITSLQNASSNQIEGNHEELSRSEVCVGSDYGSKRYRSRYFGAMIATCGTDVISRANVPNVSGFLPSPSTYFKWINLGAIIVGLFGLIFFLAALLFGYACDTAFGNGGQNLQSALTTVHIGIPISPVVALTAVNQCAQGIDMLHVIQNTGLLPASIANQTNIPAQVNSTLQQFNISSLLQNVDTSALSNAATVPNSVRQLTFNTSSIPLSQIQYLQTAVGWIDGNLTNVIAGLNVLISSSTTQNLTYSPPSVSASEKSAALADFQSRCTSIRQQVSQQQNGPQIATSAQLLGSVTNMENGITALLAIKQNLVSLVDALGPQLAGSNFTSLLTSELNQAAIPNMLSTVMSGAQTAQAVLTTALSCQTLGADILSIESQICMGVQGGLDGIWFGFFVLVITGVTTTSIFLQMSKQVAQKWRRVTDEEARDPEKK